jgi:Flp pilus assembly protein TadB
MEPLGLFFLFCIMSMMFVIMCVMLWFAYKLYRGLRAIKKVTRPLKLCVAPVLNSLEAGADMSRSANRIADEVRYIWKGY